MEGFLREVFEEAQRVYQFRWKRRKIRIYLNADHTGNTATGRSHTGIMIFVNSNSSLIASYSEKQNTVESETFGAVMVMMRIARNSTVALPRQYNVIDEQVSGETSVYESQA